MSLEFTPVWPHGEIEEILPQCFFVTGTNKVEFGGLNIQTSRNMVIIREDLKLTLINSVRLNEEGLKQLERLGQIENIVRIDAFHGRDDAFYKHYYNSAKLWLVPGMHYEHGLPGDVTLTDANLPIKDCKLFVFKSAKFPEAVLHLKREGGILISCDSIQNVTAIDKFYNAETAQYYQEQGLVQEANISPIWLQATATQKEDFAQLLSHLKFKHLFTAHGEPLLNTAYQAVQASFNRVFLNN